MAHTTFQITLALDGRHTVSATGDDPAETKLALAWAKATYEALLKRYGAPATEPMDASDDGTAPTEAPLCAVHGIPMARMHGTHGDFWSCHQRMDDGSYCTYKPAAA